MITQLCDS